MIRKTHEEFVKEVFDLVGDEYVFLGTYVNTKTSIKVRHNSEECNDHEYDVRPGNFLSGKRCPICSQNEGKRKQRLTHEEFVEKVIENRGDIYNFLTKYVNSKTKIKVEHIECGHVWDVLPYHLTEQGGKGKVWCPKCNWGVRSNLEEFKERVFNLVGNEYIVLGNYINNATHIEMLHNDPKCMHEYKVTPGHFVDGTRCPRCFGKNKRTTEEFKQLVYQLEGDSYTVLGEYINQKTYITMQHNEDCGHIFDILPTKFTDRNQRCPKCGINSKGEYAICNVLDKYGIAYKPHITFDDCRYKNSSHPLIFDIVVYENDLISYIIEYDGEQHFKPVDFGGYGEEWAQERFKKNVECDQIKNQYCKDNNIPLYRIPYWKFNEIESILIKLIHNESVDVDETSFFII